MTEYKVIVIGTSYGGVSSLMELIPKLTKITTTPIVVTIHLPENTKNSICQLIQIDSSWKACEAKEKQKLKEKHVYFAPSGCHLLLEDNYSFSLSTDEKVLFSQPSIDVLFKSVAFSLNTQVIGILLTGANADGAEGLEEIKSRGGYTIVEDPNTAIMPTMPQAALNIFTPDKIACLAEIPSLIKELHILSTNDGFFS